MSARSAAVPPPLAASLTSASSSSRRPLAATMVQPSKSLLGESSARWSKHGCPGLLAHRSRCDPRSYCAPLCPRRPRRLGLLRTSPVRTVYSRSLCIALSVVWRSLSKRELQMRYSITYALRRFPQRFLAALVGIRRMAQRLTSLLAGPLPRLPVAVRRPP
ncbi:hypothetical protein DFH06DRAFT_1316572 [Mycena polygramma]|nr:hypothetical protein DFH06DRAFT_1316572 [Mycena polygramma]